jgi:serine/threonine protein kinase
MLSLISAYKIQERLGTGPNGHVDLATSPMGSTVAIKTVNMSQLAPHLQECVHREYTVLKKLDHPHIVKLYQVIESDTEVHMVFLNSPHISTLITIFFI